MNGPIICGVDEPRTSARAMQLAHELAQRFELPLVYVHVTDGAEQNDAVRRMLHRAAAAGDAELTIETGHPADRIVELASARRASFVVLGNHGARSPLLGSVSADVSRRAPCPVIVVPPTAKSGESDLDGGIVRFGRDDFVRGVW